MNQNVSRVVLRLKTAPLAVHDWLAFGAVGAPCGHGEVGHVVAPWPQAPQLDLAIPAAWLTAHRIAVPAVNEKQRSQLIAQALEDRVLGKLADYQWQAEAIVDGICTVWVLENSKVAQLKAWAEQQNLAFSRWIPEFSLLPAQQESVYADAAEGLMARLQGDWVWLGDETELLALPSSESVQRLATKDLIAPAKTAASFYRGKSGGVSLQINWLDWRWAIYLAGLCAVVMLLSMILQWRSLANRESALRQEIRQTFASLFPGVPIVDPMLQWQSQQQAGKKGAAGGDALDLLYRSAAQLDGELGVDSVNVKDNKVQLVLPEAKSAAVLAKLGAQGMKVQSNKLPDGRMSIEVQP
ncbi:hypothetical protein HQ393_15320 [Chitinibacter bivalviorum]|uniref:GspL periplasmic domain-containing protein n=1 Tax=Chitinibacter bivalviorum TaxID=2739434 RepID=A0A7H9BLM4_9NEIS|nr:type II secretion system protein GspL [Chitinibacter bivalviorum]QLG89505.1 hypothetical protein HQ393_15320 [Chitinibacter bivalviorum]